MRHQAAAPTPGFETPPMTRRDVTTDPDSDVFQSPSSVSNDSGITDMKFYSFRSTSGRRRQPIVPDDDVETSYDASGVQQTKTPWEAVYAFRQGRKLVKPTFQGRVYNFLERPKDWRAIIYHSAVYAAILGTLLLSVLTTVAENQVAYSEAVYGVEMMLLIVFSSEYLARVWAAGCRSKYLGAWGRLKFLLKPICIIDLIIILATFLVIIFGSDGHTFGYKAIKGVRFLQILRMLHIDREGGCWRLLGSVIMEHRQEMFTALYIGFLGLVFSSYFMFLVEKDVFVDNMPSTAFATYADALWWGVVTMMTIGYGDKVPLTWTGRLLACVSALFTVSFFALPAGILGSGFALKVQQQQRQKHFSRQIPVAATLIQTLWRCYAADKHFTSVATWKIHMKDAASPTNKYNKTIAALRRRRPKYKSETDRNEQNDKSYGEMNANLEAPKPALHVSRSVPDMMISIHDDLLKKEGSTAKLQAMFSAADEYENETGDNECINMTGLTQLSENHKNAIRAIRKIKYFVAKRKFQQARKPYDVGDVIEQYSQGQISMNVRLKELHRRLDLVLGKSGNQLTGNNGKAVTIGEKLQHLDLQIQSMDKKIDDINSAIHAISRGLQKSQIPEIQTSAFS